MYYEPKGVLPVGTLYGNETNTMTGFHSIPVIAEAYLKGIKGFDINKAYQAMKVTMLQDNLDIKSSNNFITIKSHSFRRNKFIILHLYFDMRT